MLIATLALSLAATAPQVERIGDPARPDHYILQAARIPAGSETLILSGMTPGLIDPAKPASGYGDTYTQGISALKRIESILQRNGYAMRDVINLKVYLVGDPAKGGKMDFDGWNRAYNSYFNTPATPRVTRTTVQIVALAADGLLVEVDALAVKAPGR